MDGAVTYLMVALGGAIGSVARYWAAIAVARAWGAAFPWGTVLINISGSFLIAFFGGLTAASGALPASNHLRVLVMVGFCGGYTTFSSFSLQTLELLNDGQALAAMGNILVSVIPGLLAAAAGWYLAARLGVLATGQP